MRPPQTARGAWPGALIWTLAVACSPAAHAGAFDVFGFGARGIAMGGAMTASVDDHTALFYNPAALTLRKEATVGVDVYLALPDLEVSLERPTADPALAPAQVDRLTGVSVGAAFPWRPPSGPRLTFGVAAFCPTEQVFDLELLDTSVPQWARYDTLPRRLQLLTGAGVEVAPWLHVGAGAQLTAKIDGGARFEMDLVNEVVRRRDVNVGLIASAAPLAGLLITPAAGWRLGLNYRGALSLDFDLPILFELGEETDALLGVAGTTLYVPHRLSAGVAWELAPQLGVPLRISVDAAVELWSLAPAQNLKLFVDFQGDTPEGVGLDESLDFPVQTQQAAGYRDVWTGALGLEWQPASSWLWRGGYQYRPAALEIQRGPTNTLDNDAHLMSAGLGLRLPDPAGGQRPLWVELSTQVTWLAPRQTDKRDPDSAVGDYDTRGFIAVGVLSVRR